MIYNELNSYHQLYTIYDDYEGINNIKMINDNAGIAPVTVDPEDNRFIAIRKRNVHFDRRNREYNDGSRAFNLA